MTALAKQWKFIEDAAAEMGAGPEAIRKWRERGRVPHRWRLPLLKAAAARNARLDDTIFDRVPQQVA